MQTVSWSHAGRKAGAAVAVFAAAEGRRRPSLRGPPQAIAEGKCDAICRLWAANGERNPSTSLPRAVPFWQDGSTTLRRENLRLGLFTTTTAMASTTTPLRTANYAYDRQKRRTCAGPLSTTIFTIARSDRCSRPSGHSSCLSKSMPSFFARCKKDRRRNGKRITKRGHKQEGRCQTGNVMQRGLRRKTW